MKDVRLSRCRGRGDRRGGRATAHPLDTMTVAECRGSEERDGEEGGEGLHGDICFWLSADKKCSERV